MKNKGFTLIEILVTTTIFVSIFSIISGLFLSAIKVQRRALAFQELIKNSSYAMEYMGRQLRMAQKSDSSYPCAPDGANYKNYLISPGAISGDSITFRNYNNECWTFFLESGRLKINKNGLLEDFLTSEDLEVVSFKVSLSGDVTNPLDSLQPRVTLSLKIQGKGQKTEEQPLLQTQTTVSQRNLDI
jgi:prepilin-type N-terminal cleavage/methylation domain-containing protein